MKATQCEGKPFTEGSQVVTLAYITEYWIKKLALGEIHYDPRKVGSRWVTASENSTLRFKVIFNGNRKDRLQKKAA